VGEIIPEWWATSSGISITSGTVSSEDLSKRGLFSDMH
jgi:hypothetical protein